jgi:2-(1,2-epoxy-1,2-dihydrophenyl)acetyl-CoA isomerase
MLKNILLEIADGIATVTLNRPAVRNALDGQTIRDLNVALDQIQRASSGVRAVVLTGNEGTFCSGVDLHSVDLSTLEAQQRAHLEMRRYMDPLILRMSEFRFPILAAINGPAVGAGMSLALVADILVAANTAYFSPSFIKLGFVPDGGIVYHLARRIGGGRSLASLLLAERIDAATALDWGLVYSVVADGEVLARTQTLARILAAGPTRAIAKLRSLHTSAYNTSLRQHLQAERMAQEDSLVFSDCVEGVRAFFEKRSPIFRSAASETSSDTSEPRAVHNHK